MNYQAQKRQWAKRRARMMALYEEGETVKDLSKRFRITRQRVEAIVKDGNDYLQANSTANPSKTKGKGAIPRNLRRRPL